ncbi:SpaH/EbpB family LPXTG-anchored major pilin [Nesterenkonia halotolerans]|uniref:SpaH/EbpB family LPXTG-anchored major pilin n=1 Tax=Nesterenkonia halotolerans TaxID=225325 RepID=UPI003EE4C79D
MSPVPSARRSTISVGALIGAFALLLSGVAPASATTGGTPTIDPSATGSITIHKLAQSDAGGDSSHQGEERDVSGTPLSGVEFTIRQVRGIELDSAAGWREMEQLNSQPVDDKVLEGLESRLASPRVVETDGNGSAAAGGLPIGLYLVEETDSGENNVVEPVDPFLVSLPTAGAQNEWLYNVHAYPKNSVVTIGMTVDEKETFGLNNGPIDWTITTSVPRLPANENFESYELRVALDERLALPDGALQEASISIGDYRGSLSDVGAKIEDGALVISSSDAGVLALLGERQGQPVSITIPSRIVSNDIDGGSIQNTATVSVNGSAPFSAEAHTDWGAVKIIARTADSEQGLEGGLYEVRRSSAGEPLEINDVSSFESNASGEVIVPGLRAGDGYFLAEIQAPRGYTQMSQPVPFDVQPAGTVEVEGAESPGGRHNVVVVEKTQVSGFALPITGSFGSLPFLLAGLLLVATALIVNRSRRRRLARAV